MIRSTLALVAGIVGGALFGVLFGAFASVFQNGPELAVGVSESWPWFALVGGLVSCGWSLSYELDARRTSTP